jgi:hypothetical protein
VGQTTVRITESTRILLRRLAAAEGRPMQLIIAAALEAYRRERFLKAVNDGYAALREDPAGWAAVAAERTAWDPTLLDGLPADTVDARRRRKGGRRRQGRGRER